MLGFVCQNLKNITEQIGKKIAKGHWGMSSKESWQNKEGKNVRKRPLFF